MIRGDGVNVIRFFRLLLLICWVPMTACQSETEPPLPLPKPNILLVVLDDFGYNDLALNNGSDSPTPTLDNIARQGIRFTRHYTESSCTPSRMALLTGMYPARLGAHPNGNGIDHELVTLPDLLRQHGYTNYMIGKWHAGDAHRESRPEYQGFDHWFGFMSQMYLRGPHKPPGYTRRRPTYLKPWLEDETGDLRRYPGHLTDILTDRALEVMATEQDSWFIYLPYYAPHTPLQPSKPYMDKFPADAAGRYQAVKAQLDTNIGRIIAYLEESGKLLNTMIVVVSDNGGTAKNWPSNLPFHGEKATYAEGGIRTPLLVWWPGHWSGGGVRDQVAIIFDLYPTIASALGIPVPEALDGVDLFAPAKARELHWYSHSWYSIYGNLDMLGMLSADGQWRLSIWQNVAEQLYKQSDLVAGEPVDRLEQNPRIAAAMRDTAQRWMKSVTRVNPGSRKRDGSWAVYSGSAFRRTPLSAAHSMGFVFRRGADDYSAAGRQQLVLQEGYIDISEEDGALRVRVDGNEAEIVLPGNQQCFSLIVSSAMIKNHMVYYRPEQFSRTRVYLNAERVADSPYQNPELNSASPRNPLKVNIDPGSRWYMPPPAEIFLSTRVVHESEIRAEIEPELGAVCDEAAIAPGR